MVKLKMRGPVQMRLQNSGIAGPKFIKFLQDVEGSSLVLTRVSMLRYSIRCEMPAHRMKVGYANFRRFAQKSVTLERSLKEGWIDHAHPSSYLP